ncbi:MAG: RraA family protein [Phycicoccus sp.]
MGTQIDRSEVRRRYRAVQTANVSDVLDDLGLGQQCLHGAFAARSGTQLAGWAFPIAGRMQPGGGPTDQVKIEACAAIGPDEVAVWAGDGEGVCYFGELIAIGLQQRGCRGALVEGGVRDIAWLEEVGFPVFSTYRTPVQSIGRWQVTGFGEPVGLPGATSDQVTVSRGDFVLADVDGVVVVPADQVMTVLDRAEAVTAREIAIRVALAGGAGLDEAIDRFGPI